MNFNSRKILAFHFPISIILTAIKNRLSLPLGHFLLRKSSGDQFIAAFPRSGSTWLRTILVNILFTEANSNPDVFNIKIPGVSIRGALRINTMPPPRIIMTHSICRKEISRAVYLVRDGRDALVSFYHYLTTRNNQIITFPMFWKLYCIGIYGIPWHKHIESWLVHGRQTMGNQLLVIRFEDMKKDTEAVICEVTNFLGISSSIEKIHEAINKASLERMKKIEMQRKGFLYDENASFYRGGISGQYNKYLKGDIVEKFYRISGASLKIAGYLE